MELASPHTALAPALSISGLPDKANACWGDPPLFRWLLHPIDRVLTIYRLGNGSYGRPDVQALTGSTEVSVIKGLSIHWPDPAAASGGDSIEEARIARRRSPRT